MKPCMIPLFLCRQRLYLAAIEDPKFAQGTDFVYHISEGHNGAGHFSWMMILSENEVAVTDAKFGYRMHMDKEAFLGATNRRFSWYQMVTSVPNYWSPADAKAGRYRLKGGMSTPDESADEISESDEGRRCPSPTIRPGFTGTWAR